MSLAQDDANRVLLHLLDQATTDRHALVRSVKAQIANARAELAEVEEEESQQ